MLHSIATALLVTCVGAVLARASSVRGTFDQMVRESGVVYTPTELTQHFVEFSRKLAFRGLDEVDRSHTFMMSRPALMESEAAAINAVQDAWVASADQPRFRGATVEDFTALLGNMSEAPAKLSAQERVSVGLIPKEFNAIHHFSHCADVIGHVRDQANCYNCGAIAAVSTLSDRLCIKTGKHVQLSAMHATACCTPAQGCMENRGCDEGNSADPWNWLVKYGVVSGGDYGSASGCWPYPLPKCSQNLPVPGMPMCDTLDDAVTPACVAECPNKSYEPDFELDRHFLDGIPETAKTVEGIKAEVFLNGPVSAGFQLFEDFVYYQSGVYTPTTDVMDGGHASRIIGWGTQDGMDYWLVVNSWNENWGDHGFVKIQQGTCMIEDYIIFGRPLVAPTSPPP